MTSDKSSFERLCDAGVIAGEHFSESDKAVIAKITSDEVDVLIKLRKKMGEGTSGKDHMRPNFAV